MSILKYGSILILICTLHVYVHVEFILELRFDVEFYIYVLF